MTDSSGTGLGILNLSALNTYTGPTKIAGGTLQLGIANAINSASTINMAGGTFSLNNFGEQAGMLKTTATSTIDLTTGNSAAKFSNSPTPVPTTGRSDRPRPALRCTSPTGLETSPAVGPIKSYSPVLRSLTPNQLNQIIFDGSGTNPCQADRHRRRRRIGTHQYGADRAWS